MGAVRQGGPETRARPWPCSQTLSSASVCARAPPAHYPLAPPEGRPQLATPGAGSPSASASLREGAIQLSPPNGASGETETQKG